jgi:pimeloyl-ACP methyl ester carboxylesterase
MTATAPIPTPQVSLWSTTREALGLLELPRLALALRSLLREPRGDGSCVLVLPGFGTDDRATWPLRRFLEGRGYEARGWGLGANVAEVPESIERMRRVVEAAVEEHGAKVALVGWSLGGYIAREVARELPRAVRRVLTLGSPVIGGPKYTTAAALSGTRGWDLDEIEAWVEERKRVPLRVPVTAIYSRRDGVVSWRACVDPEGDGPIEHVEVDSTHVGLGFSAEVYRLVARRLALPAEPPRAHPEKSTTASSQARRSRRR